MAVTYRFLFVLIILLMSGGFSYAQKGGLEFEGGLSFGLHARTGYADNNKIIIEPDPDNERDYSYDKTVILPVFDLTVVYCFKDSKFAVGLENSVDYAYKKTSGKTTDKELLFYTMPVLRYYYVRVHDLSIYSAVAYGPRFRKYSTTVAGEWQSDWYISGSYLLMPVGICLGERLFLSIEAAVGSPWSPVKLSVGYRF